MKMPITTSSSSSSTSRSKPSRLPKLKHNVGPGPGKRNKKSNGKSIEKYSHETIDYPGSTSSDWMQQPSYPLQPPTFPSAPSFQPQPQFMPHQFAPEQAQFYQPQSAFYPTVNDNSNPLDSRAWQRPMMLNGAGGLPSAGPPSKPSNMVPPPVRSLGASRANGGGGGLSPGSHNAWTTWLAHRLQTDGGFLFHWQELQDRKVAQKKGLGTGLRRIPEDESGVYATSAYKYHLPRLTPMGKQYHLPKDY